MTILSSELLGMALREYVREPSVFFIRSVREIAFYLVLLGVSVDEELRMTGAR